MAKSREEAFSEDAARAARWIAKREGCPPEVVAVQTITYHEDGSIQTAMVSNSGGPPRRFTLSDDKGGES